MFSSRLNWSASTNRLSRAVAERRHHGDFIDLTGSNPTRAGFTYPVETLRDALGAAAGAPYDPDPRGTSGARQILAGYLSAAGDRVDPEDLFLLASTSEAYSCLFKLLADPGDEVLIARPAYPLLEHLAALEGLRLRHYSLTLSMSRRTDGARRSRWSLEIPELSAAVTDQTRCVVVVHPNNPTGNYVNDAEASELRAFCERRQLALISDEVFREYSFGSTDVPSLASTHSALTFTLGGLSKLAGLPHYKLGWIRVSGDEALRREAKKGLELIADTYLSVATPVQAALGPLLLAGDEVRRQIRARTRSNLATLASAFSHLRSIELLQPEGGWSAIVRVPHIESDEELALQVLANANVLIQPGYLYDFENDGFLVVSLLAPPEMFAAGTARLVDYLSARFS